MLTSDRRGHNSRDTTLWLRLSPENPWCHLRTRNPHSKRRLQTYLEKLYGVRRPVHWLDWRIPATIKEGYSNMQCVELVLLIRCTRELSSSGRPPFDSMKYNSFLEEIHITCALPTEQLPNRNGRKASQKNADVLNRWLWSPTSQSGGTSHDDAWKSIPSGPWLVTSRGAVRLCNKRPPPHTLRDPPDS